MHNNNKNFGCVVISLSKNIVEELAAPWQSLVMQKFKGPFSALPKSKLELTCYSEVYWNT